MTLLHHQLRRPVRTALEELAATGMPLANVPLLAEDEAHDLFLWQHPDQLIARACIDYARLLDLALAPADLSISEMAQLRVALGIGSSRRLPDILLASNLHVRRQTYRSLSEAVRAEWEAGRASGRRWFFVTLLTDTGNALEYDTVVEFFRTKRDINRILSEIGLHATGMLEIQAATNFPKGGYGCSLELHGHYLGYTDESSFRPQATIRRLCQREVLSNWLGAPTASIKFLPSFGSLLDSCRYIAKPPVKGHYLTPDDRGNSGFTRKRTDVTAPVALRLAEVLSQLTVLDLASATGKGGIALKRAWRSDLQAWHDSHSSVWEIDAPALIQKVWATGRTTVPRLPAQIRWDARLPQCEKWRTAMTDHIDKVGQVRRGR